MILSGNLSQLPVALQTPARHKAHQTCKSTGWSQKHWDQLIPKQNRGKDPSLWRSLMQGSPSSQTHPRATGIRCSHSSLARFNFPSLPPHSCTPWSQHPLEMDFAWNFGSLIHSQEDPQGREFPPSISFQVHSKIPKQPSPLSLQKSQIYSLPAAPEIPRK